jgi:2OG-Fe(II) oxygenase superfamily
LATVVDAGSTPAGRLPLDLRLSTERAGAYQRARPFPHAVIDGLFPERALREVLAEFPRPDDIEWIRFKRGNERKLASSDARDFGPSTHAFLAELNSHRFLTFLEQLTGISGLIPDPYFEGGGLHQIEQGGYLNLHVDFNRHRRFKLDRRLNLIVYLNEGWREEWGGHIEFWDRNVRRCEHKILPLFNRTVIFSTTESSWHGHPTPLTNPTGTTRKSLALYYYTNGRPRSEQVLSHSTTFRLRPGDALRFSYDVLLTKLLPPLVIDVGRLLRDRFARSPSRTQPSRAKERKP